MVMDNAMIRKCGSFFSYCNGNCSDCEANNFAVATDTTISTQYTQAVDYATPQEDEFGKPTSDAYEKAKKDCELYSNCIYLSRKRKNELLDDLCDERASEKFYVEMYEKCKEIVRRYEIYEEITSTK